MKYLILVFFAFVTLSAIAQPEIKIEDAKNHVGDSVKICSIAYGGKYFENAPNTPTLINLGAAYPNALLTVVISAGARSQFKVVPEDFFNKLEVCVVGRIELYKDKPQIVISSSRQLYNNQ